MHKIWKLAQQWTCLQPSCHAPFNFDFEFENFDMGCEGYKGLFHFPLLCDPLYTYYTVDPQRSQLRKRRAPQIWSGMRWCSFITVSTSHWNKPLFICDTTWFSWGHMSFIVQDLVSFRAVHFCFVSCLVLNRAAELQRQSSSDMPEDMMTCA